MGFEFRTLRLLCFSDPPEGRSPRRGRTEDGAGVMTRSWCRKAFDYVFEPSSGKILGASLTFAVGFFVASTTIDNSKHLTLGVCFGFAGLCSLVAVIAAVIFVKLKIGEGERKDEANRAGQRPPSFRV